MIPQHEEGRLPATQEAIKTGRLFDNRRNLIETAHKASKLSNPEWKQKIDHIYKLLQTARNRFTKALGSGLIQQWDFRIEFRDAAIEQELNLLRREAVEMLNGILTEADIDPVKSELLR